MLKIFKRTNLSAILKIFCGTAVVTGAGLFTYGINRTYDHISGVVNTRVLDLERRKATYIFLEDPEVKEILNLHTLDENGLMQPNSITSAIIIWWKNLKFRYALQLMSIATCCDCISRWKAIGKLINCTYLSSTEYAHLAQKCDGKTAVGLARTRKADTRLFSRRLPKKVIDKQVLITKLRDLLVELNKRKEHECLTYFLSKTFPGFHNEKGTFFDIDIRGKIRPPPFYNEDILPKCVKELAHYCTIENNVEEVMNLRGLELLREIYKDVGDQYAIEFVKILEQVSLYPSNLNHVFFAGWIDVLARWLQHKDKRVSARATHTLANFDSDDMFNASYGPRILLLHPAYRRFISRNCVDVVFIHGLLGGALVTWRQRDVGLYQITFCDLQSPQTTSEPPQKKRIMDTSDTATKEYLKTVQDLKQEEWEKVGDDFEFVLCDFPTKMNSTEGCLSIPGSNSLVKKCIEEEGTNEFSSCWPLDWLAKDCPSIRLLCVNYDTRLSDWQYSCQKGTKRDIESLSDSLLDELVETGIGQRPVVWVVHSMGGLIVKSMLIKAWERRDIRLQEFQKNTKGIVFLSTPHLGSLVATMFDSHRSILWPSNEVDDLRVDSAYLKKLHKKFLEWEKEVPQTIVTIAETRPTQLSGLGLWVEFLFVSQESADPGIGDVYFLPYDHVNICKPSNRLSFIYKKVLEVVQIAISSTEK